MMEFHASTSMYSFGLPGLPSIRATLLPPFNWLELSWLVTIAAISVTIVTCFKTISLLKLLVVNFFPLVTTTLWISIRYFPMNGHTVRLELHQPSSSYVGLLPYSLHY